MATNGNDVLTFQGTLGQLTMMLFNPYSGETVFIDEEMNINITSYDGLGGLDTMNMTNHGDALFIVDNLNQQVVKNVEVFIAGDGGDVIHLAHQTYTMGDLTILGGAGNDVLWGNIGNDLVSGGRGDDIIDGGPGHDALYGDEGNDRIAGGVGDDLVVGYEGDDLLFGGNDTAPIVIDKNFSDNVIFPHLMEGVNIVNLVPPGTPALGVANGNMHFEHDGTATLTFRSGWAGYNNTLGVYRVAGDGTIELGTVLWANIKTAGIDVAHTINLPGTEGGDFGFFIIANGDNANSHYTGLDITGEGNVRFVYDYGLVTERAATVNDDGNHVKIVYDDGVTQQVLGGYHYHTTERGGSTNINWDHMDHVVTGLVDVGQQDVLRVGFEDLPNLGDADYEDVFFDLNIDEVITEGDSEDGNDKLVGNEGNDTLYGLDGDDILIVGEGADDIYGGRGSDQIVFSFMDNLVDVIHGFETGLGGDVLNFTDILQGYDELTDALADFVQIVSLNNDSHVRINADGDSGGTFTEIAVIAGVDTTLADLINQGNIVANQHIGF